MSEELPQVEKYAGAVRKLLKGVVYHDDALWKDIRDYEWPIREYLRKIGLDLHLDEIGSFAYLKDLYYDDEDNKHSLPALTTRRALSFLDTLLLVLLRERLDEHEVRDLDGSPLLLSMEMLKEMVGVFMLDHPNAQKTEQNVETSVNRLASYGFLTKHRDGNFEVRPLLRAKISADELDNIKTNLTNYLRQDDDLGENNGEPV
ncbi:MAG: DUF4194 domain-containing protein [Anaerolineae bacterium]|nr:DUF4194 domain-containing protein [Anaerolineae bacterium]